MKLHCFCLTRSMLCLLIWHEVRSHTHQWSLRICLPRMLVSFLIVVSSDYVQVVDMGTLELRITAVKPGQDGNMVWKSSFIGCLLSDIECPNYLSSAIYVSLGRAKVWVALLKWCYSHSHLFRLLCRSHEPYSVHSQLWRSTAPFWTGG